MSLRRTPLKRGTSQLKRTRLESHTPLARRTPLMAKSAPKPVRVKPAVPRDVRVALVARSNGKCEIRLPGCWDDATETSHRIKVGSGGRHGAAKLAHDVLSNVMDACHLCHVWVETRRAAARKLGLALKRHEIPSQEPVLYKGLRWMWLADDGQVVDYEAAAA
jgi:hypothetical protein